MTITTWLTASRWTYNLTAEILQSGIPAVWKHIASMVMPEVKTLHPEWDSVPYQVKRTAVRDACRAMSNVKTFNLELKFHQAQGNRADEEFAQLGYRSRQNPKQSCYIPDVPRQLYLPVGVNQFCRFTSLAWPRCWAALVR